MEMKKRELKLTLLCCEDVENRRSFARDKQKGLFFVLDGLQKMFGKGKQQVDLSIFLTFR